MTYKGMLLSALLVPVAVTCYGKESVDSRLQQLKEARYQKELELSELGAKIAGKYELLENIRDEAIRFCKKYAEDSDLKGDELRERGRSIDTANDEMGIRLEKVLVEGNVKGFFLKELFEDESVNDENLNTVRFFCIRLFFERKFIKIFVERYETCLQQLVEIDREISDMEKKI